MRILIKNCDYWTGGEKTLQGSIGISDKKIKWLGTEPPSNWQPDKVIDGKNKLALPGFVNTHNHAAMTLFRSYADDLVLQDWLENKIWPIEAKLTGKDVYWGTELAIAEMIRFGTTSFCDMYFFMDDVAHAVEESGMRAVLCRGITGFSPADDIKLVESEEFFNNWQKKADGRIEVWLGPHAPYTCPPEYLKKVSALAEKLDANIHIHLAETKKEVDDCLAAHQATPIELMKQVGLFDHTVLAAHCVHLSENDMDIIAEKNVRVAHNPGSNLKLASGIAPIPELLKRNVTIGLGTDGASSNNNLDMLEEIRLSALLHKNNTGNPTVLPAHQALFLGTLGGAQALGWQNDLGSLEVGKKADVILLDMSEAHWYPTHNLISTLVYSAQSSDVSDVIVDGKILLENREYKTLDIEKIKHEANQSAQRLSR